MRRGIRERVLLMILATTALFCGSLPASWSAEKAPDLSAMVVMVGRWGAGYACPVGPHTLYTAAHMTDVRPFDADIPLYPSLIEQDGKEDLAIPLGVDGATDAAIMKPRTITLRYFPRVTERPKVGDQLWDIGWEWDSRKEYGHERTISAKVTRVVAGHVFLTASAGPGSSGSCWVNARGEAVAINSKMADCGAGDPCSFAAVGMWPPWQFKDEEKPEDAP